MPIKHMSIAKVRSKVRAKMILTADLEEQKPEWTELMARMLKKFINTSRLTLVMAMSDSIENEDNLNLGDGDDDLEAVQFAMWRIPSKTPFHLLSGTSAGGNGSNLDLLKKVLREKHLDMIIESVNGQMYISLSTDYRLFAPSAML